MIATVMFATLHGASIESIYMYSSIFSSHFVKLKLHLLLNAPNKIGASSQHKTKCKIGTLCVYQCRLSSTVIHA